MNKIWLDRESKEWNDAFPIGNGILGAMVFGGTKLERIQVNEDSVWSGGFVDRVNPDAKEQVPKVRELLQNGAVEEAEQLASRSMFASYPHMRHYQTLGDVWIDFFDHKGKQMIQKMPDLNIPFLSNEEKEVAAYRRELDLDRSIGDISYKMNGISYKREFFASHPENILVYHITADKDEKITFETYLTRKDNRRGRGLSFCDGSQVLDKSTIRLYGKQGGDEGIGYELAARVVSTGGKQYSMGSHMIVENATEATIYITARTTYREERPLEYCLKRLSDVVQKEYQKIKEDHRKDYQQLFLSSQLKLKTDEALEQLPTHERLNRLRAGKDDIGLIQTYYNFSRYLLISSSRAESLPANLQGIWNGEFEPMWGSKYTININIQMNYWMAEKGGLSELHLALLNHLKTMYPHGKTVAKEMYGIDGFCCHHNTDIWGDCAPQDSNICSTIWPMSGAWLCLHAIEHFQYTQDSLFLKEFYPIIKDAVKFFQAYLIEDQDGYLISGPSSSPENIYVTANGQYGSLCMGPSMDAEIIRELYTGYLEVAAAMGDQDEVVEKAKAQLTILQPIRIGKYGQIQEWNQDYEEMDKGHRHISQLFALYPGNQIRVDRTPELAAAAEKTLERRLENGGGHTGWSKAWIILFFARLRKAEDAWKNLKELLEHATLDNLLDNHPPFQIDGNFGGAAGLMEMLVQDYSDIVYLLPALPKAIPEGTVTGIHLKKGVVLDMSWEKGAITSFNIQAARNCALTIVSEKHASLYINLKENEVKCYQEEDLK
ncbi:MAG: glycoside hydrolase family 95 protein [Hespellia sp.]|nr:glycoside hydrolase family 95 protein [Hespellia sp.]